MMIGKVSKGEELRIEDERVQLGWVEIPIGTWKRDLSASWNRIQIPALNRRQNKLSEIRNATWTTQPIGSNWKPLWVFGTGHPENIRRNKGADLEQIGKRWEHFEETYGWSGEG
jgi:hypothetical protein